MKNTILTLLAVLTLSTATPSKAAVGGITTNPVLVYSGLGLWAAAQGAVFVFPERNGGGSAWPVLPLFILGTILLDGEDGQSVQYTALDKVSAEKLKMTEAERLSFNAEIDQANSLVAEVSAELSHIENATAKDSAAIWSNMKDLVSEETMNAMIKINSQFAK